MRSIAFLTAALLFSTPSLALAGDECGDGAIDIVRHIFEQADRDHDGGLTRAEYEAAGLQSYGVTFEQSDLDGDGRTSADEYLELYRRHHPTTPDGVEA